MSGPDLDDIANVQSLQGGFGARARARFRMHAFARQASVTRESVASCAARRPRRLLPRVARGGGLLRCAGVSRVRPAAFARAAARRKRASHAWGLLGLRLCVC
jgi:hypothetical protein